MLLLDVTPGSNHEGELHAGDRSTLLKKVRFHALMIIAECHRDVRLSVTIIAGYLAVSRRHLDRAFQGGPSVKDYITQCRLATAIAFLGTVDSLDEVAQKSGFAKRNTLREQFVARFQVQPSEARVLLKQLDNLSDRYPISLPSNVVVR